MCIDSVYNERRLLMRKKSKLLCGSTLQFSLLCLSYPCVITDNETCEDINCHCNQKKWLSILKGYSRHMAYGYDKCHRVEQ